MNSIRSSRKDGLIPIQPSPTSEVKVYFGFVLKPSCALPTPFQAKIHFDFVVKLFLKQNLIIFFKIKYVDIYIDKFK